MGRLRKNTKSHIEKKNNTANAAWKARKKEINSKREKQVKGVRS